MKGLFWRRGVAALSATCHLFIVIALQLALPAHAQTQDFEPPSIGIDGADEGSRGVDQTFTVTATDNQAVGSVVFNFRIVTFDDSQEYQSGEMMKIGDTDLYTFTIAADLIDSSAEGIEYYIDARDESGNRTLQGFSFDPLERTLVGAVLEPQAESDGQSSDQPIAVGALSTTQKVVYSALGVLVVGALIAASSDDGDSTSTTGPATGPEVTITIAPLDVTP